MSVKIEPSGRRSVQAEVEVPGTPEEVWQAIATGQGVSSWFVPTEFRDDNTVVSHFGPGMDAVATITAWDPPRRFAAESRDLGPDAPAMATAWTVEARAGGTCVVRVVHSLFASTDAWDDQLEGAESGWPSFFTQLALYLEHFAGQRVANMLLTAFSPRSAPETWSTLMHALNLEGVSPGDERSAPAAAPTLSGVIERAGGTQPHSLVMRMREPSPGLLSMGAIPMGDKVCVVVSGYLFGERAPAIAETMRPAWQAWLDERFTPAADAAV